MTITQLTQMALSAILRCKEQINIFELNSVLCGKSTRDIRQKGFDKIKTFGAGKLYSDHRWHYMFIQMIQQDFFEIDYKKSYYLKVTEKGHQVLNGQLEVKDIIIGRPAKSAFQINGVFIQIDEDIFEAIEWKKLLNDLNSIIYWNYIEEKRLDVNRIIPPSTYEREIVKHRFLELAQQIFNLSIEGDEIIVPLKVDYDMYGNVVRPLSLPFDECLDKLRQFIETTGRYPQMAAVAEEVALRKWFREVGHGILQVTPEQKEKFNRFTEKYPISKYKALQQEQAK